MILSNCFSFKIGNRGPKKDIWIWWFLRLIKTGQTLNILPFSYDSKTSLIKCSPLSSRLILYFMAFCFISDDIYLFLVAKYVTVLNTTAEEFTNFYLHSFSRCVAGILVVILFQKMSETIQYTNALIIMRRKMQGRFFHLIGIIINQFNLCAVFSSPTCFIIWNIWKTKTSPWRQTFEAGSFDA